LRRGDIGDGVRDRSPDQIGAAHRTDVDVVSDARAAGRTIAAQASTLDLDLGR
jgi:hypothetical protein